MHLPPSTQYFCICHNTSQVEEFYPLTQAISVEYGIQIQVHPITLESCLDLVKTEHDRNFFIFILSDSQNFRSSCLDKFNLLLKKTNCNHKLAIIDNKSKESRDEIYFTLLGSLNLARVFSRDGLIKTYGIQLEDYSSSFKSNLVPIFSGPPDSIEIANVQPIILDFARCGILEPVLYFVASNFGTLTPVGSLHPQVTNYQAHVLMPNSSVWKLAYLIQCDDSGRNDVDMVKVCFVEEDHQVAFGVEDSARHLSNELTVLHNNKYSICRDFNLLINDLINHPNSEKVINPLLKTISDALKLSKADEASVFPDAVDLAQVKRKYSRLFTELSDDLVKIPGKTLQNRLKDSIKSMRRMINVLNIAAKNLKFLDSSVMISKTPQWMDEAHFYASPRVRSTPDGVKIRRNRLENEQKNGIVSTPLLEPYLEVIWPRNYPARPESYPHESFKQYAQKLIDVEMDLQLNKRFGV